MKIRTLSEIIINLKFSNEICENKSLEAILQEANVSETDIEPECILTIKKIVNNLCKKVNKKWQESYRNKYTYEARNTTWLDKDIQYELIKCKAKRKLIYDQPGRPIGSSSKKFSDLERTQKWRKTKVLASEHDKDELISATVSKLKESKSELQYISKMSPSEWKKIKEAEKGNV